MTRDPVALAAPRCVDVSCCDFCIRLSTRSITSSIYFFEPLFPPPCTSAAPFQKFPVLVRGSAARFMRSDAMAAFNPANRASIAAASLSN